jgi:hypothetical protein
MVDLERQEAPEPSELRALIDALEYKDGWLFELTDLDRGQDRKGFTFVIEVTSQDSYNHKLLRRVRHYMPVPRAAFDNRSWQRWLLEQILLVENHEACEFFTLNGVKPYAPAHGSAQPRSLSLKVARQILALTVEQHIRHAIHGPRARNRD